MKTVFDIAPQQIQPQKKKRVAAYARVSSGKDAMLHSLKAQIDYYHDYINRNPEWVFAGIYADEAKTGTKDSREQFRLLLDDCRAGKIDMVVTKAISRFARNTVTLLETVRELQRLGIDVYFEEQNIYTLSTDGELMLTLLASFAQEESLSASENQKWRIRKGFEQGKASTCNMLGYRLVDGEITIVPDEAEIVRRIFELYHSGCMGCRKSPTSSMMRDTVQSRVPNGGFLKFGACCKTRNMLEICFFRKFLFGIMFQRPAFPIGVNCLSTM